MAEVDSFPDLRRQLAVPENASILLPTVQPPGLLPPRTVLGRVRVASNARSNREARIRRNARLHRPAQTRGLARATNVDPIEVENPELVIGMVAGVGAPLEQVQRLLAKELKAFGYDSEVLHLSRFTRHFELKTPMPAKNSREAARIDAMMNRGNEARE